MKQYLDLLQKILSEGTYKPAAREGMPGSYSLFGPQIEFDLADGFPLTTTKKTSFKNIVIELIWFLKGDSNIKYLIDNGVNIWNQDAYNFYVRQCKAHLPESTYHPISFKSWVGRAREAGPSQYIPNYNYGDTGFQYPQVWRRWQSLDGTYPEDYPIEEMGISCVDQITRLLHGLRTAPESRRHVVTSIDPANDTPLDVSLYWCHSMFQYNCRPIAWADQVRRIGHENTPLTPENIIVINEDIEESSLPKYYLDCKMYQRSADMFLGVPYNIASYALLTEILAKLTGMIPGKFIHTFGDAHIYENHFAQVKEQLTREPKTLPKLYWHTQKAFENEGILLDDFLNGFEFDDLHLGGYDPHPAIKGDLSTGV